MIIKNEKLKKKPWNCTILHKLDFKFFNRVSEISVLNKRKRGAEEEDERKIKKKPALDLGEDEDDIAEEEDEAVLVEDEEQDHEDGEDMLKVEKEVEEIKVDEEEKVDSWINCSESNSCDSSISMSIRSGNHFLLLVFLLFLNYCFMLRY